MKQGMFVGKFLIDVRHAGEQHGVFEIREYLNGVYLADSGGTQLLLTDEDIADHAFRVFGTMDEASRAASQLRPLLSWSKSRTGYLTNLRDRVQSLGAVEIKALIALYENATVRAFTQGALKGASFPAARLSDAIRDLDTTLGEFLGVIVELQKAHLIEVVRDESPDGADETLVNYWLIVNPLTPDVLPTRPIARLAG